MNSAIASNACAVEREMLLREVNHRVGNSLQLIAAFLQLQAGGTSSTTGEGGADRRDPAGDGGRAGSQASLHIKRRAVGVDRPISRRRWWMIMSKTDDSRDSRRSVSTRKRLNSIRTAPWPSASSLTSSCSTPMKYAYPEQKGPIRIGLKRVNGRRAILSVEDDGIGHDANTKAKSTGLGRSIVGAMATRLGAQVVYDPGPTAARVVCHHLRNHAATDIVLIKRRSLDRVRPYSGFGCHRPRRHCTCPEERRICSMMTFAALMQALRFSATAAPHCSAPSPIPISPLSCCWCGIYALLLEFAHPGTFLPAITGIVCLPSPRSRYRRYRCNMARWRCFSPASP